MAVHVTEAAAAAAGQQQSWDVVEGHEVPQPWVLAGVASVMVDGTLYL